MTLDDAGRARIERELDVIEEKDFAGYFLIVWDIVRYAREQGILCQGRGTAANSVVCYLLQITAVDSIRFDLPFERFLSSDARGGAGHRRRLRLRPPRGGHPVRLRQVRAGTPRRCANVIRTGPSSPCATWPRRSATAPASRTPGRGRWSAGARSISSDDHDIPDSGRRPGDAGAEVSRGTSASTPAAWCSPTGPSARSCPIEHARMENRTVLQWDKDDCAWMGLVKFDLLGLGMLSALQYCFDLVRESLGEAWDLDTIPKEEQGVYDQLCRADADRRLPGRDPRPDGPPAAPAAATLLRPRRRDRARASRPHPGRRRAPLRAAQARAGAGHLPAPEARRTAGTHPRRADLPGAAHADRGRGRRLHGRRRRPAAPGDGLQARHREDRAAAREALRRHGRQRHRRRRTPTRSTARSRPSRGSASPRATH